MNSKIADLNNNNQVFHSTTWLRHSVNTRVRIISHVYICHKTSIPWSQNCGSCHWVFRSSYRFYSVVSTVWKNPLHSNRMTDWREPILRQFEMLMWMKLIEMIAMQMQIIELIKISSIEILAKLRLEMYWIEIDSNDSISTFDLKSTRIESQKFELFNFDSSRFQFTSNSVKIDVSSKKNSSLVLIMIICNSQFTNFNVVLLSSCSRYVIKYLFNIFRMRIRRHLFEYMNTFLEYRDILLQHVMQ
jgi:hypothetical protein